MTFGMLAYIHYTWSMQRMFMQSASASASASVRGKSNIFIKLTNEKSFAIYGSEFITTLLISQNIFQSSWITLSILDLQCLNLQM